MSFMHPPSGFGKARVVTVWALVATAALPAWCVHPCAKCHPNEVAGYAATQMGQSFGPPTRQPSGKFLHSLSKTQFVIESSDVAMIQQLGRNGLTAQYEIAYALGSGIHAIAYIIQLDHHLFQSPVGYFPGRGWDMSPGYEDSKSPDFYRPVTPDCLFCHTGQGRPVPGAFNSYQTPPFEAEAITCERCHGPVEAHLRNPIPGSIINPANLPPRARDSVCEQCHLSGEERVPNPGKQLSHFRPGQELEEVYSVYVFEGSRDPGHPGALKVISQAQQLALSMCARRSHGKLWCGTCHNPHQQPADPKTYFRKRCLSCHGTALIKNHSKPNDDCIGCHMPRRPVSDGGHTVFTDHHIGRRPPSQASTAGTDEPQSLVAWRDPPGALARRNLGLADIRVGIRLESSTMVNQGFQLLLDCWPSFPNDPALLTGMGKALLASGHGADAAAAFEQAIQMEPNVALHYLQAGLAWNAAHDAKTAVARLEKACQLDPLMEEPYLELAAIYSQAHDSTMVRQTYERYLKAFPKSMAAQTAAANSRVMCP